MEDTISNLEYYAEYINSHTEEIAAYVDGCFKDAKEFIRAKILKEIGKYLTPLPVHYEWQPDDCPYDRSGVLVPVGKINMVQTISEFLENEYTGSCIPSYESGCGLYYETYGEKLHYLTTEIGGQVMNTGIKRFLEQQFRISMSENDFEILCDECYQFDEIYDESLTSDFFSYEGVVDFLEISDILIGGLVLI